MEKYKKENEMIKKKLANIDKEIEILHQHEEETVTKRLFDEKIAELENIIADKDNMIHDFVQKMNEMESRIDTLENPFIEKISVLEDKVSAIEKESNINNQNDEKM